MFLKTVALEGLLVLNLFLRIFVRLQNLVVLLLAFFKKLVHLILKLLSQSVHFILLLLHELGLSSQYFLMTHLHMVPSFRLLKLISTLLDLMSLLVILLLGQVLLNFALVEKLSRLFEFKR